MTCKIAPLEPLLAGSASRSRCPPNLGEQCSARNFNLDHYPLLRTLAFVYARLMTELFPDADYRFQMNLERGSVTEFFRPTASQQKILTERQLWLGSDPNKYSAALEESGPLLVEAIDVLLQAAALTSADADNCHRRVSSMDRCRELGRILEPDFLLLIPQTDGQFQLVGACVCFPSSWSLSEKIGRPLDFIHSVVPDLNSQIGTQISRFLSSLKPGFAWLRANWGLSRSGEWNQHPARELTRLDQSTPFEEIWLRIERQALVLLPRSQSILFGIRIETYPLTETKKNAAEARGLARALRTMPEPMALYKNISAVRESVARTLEVRTADEI